MKCVRVGDHVGVVVGRFTDEEAFEIVRDGDGQYCSKSFYRVWHGRPNSSDPKPEASDEG